MLIYFSVDMEAKIVPICQGNVPVCFGSLSRSQSSPCTITLKMNWNEWNNREWQLETNYWTLLFKTWIYVRDFAGTHINSLEFAELILRGDFSLSNWPIEEIHPSLLKSLKHCVSLEHPWPMIPRVNQADFLKELKILP